MCHCLFVCLSVLLMLQHRRLRRFILINFCFINRTNTMCRRTYRNAFNTKVNYECSLNEQQTKSENVRIKMKNVSRRRRLSFVARTTFSPLHTHAINGAIVGATHRIPRTRQFVNFISSIWRCSGENASCLVYTSRINNNEIKCAPVFVDTTNDG